MNAREVAVRLLLDWEENGKYANLSLQSPLYSALSEKDRSLVTTLFYTAVERKITLDYYIGVLTGGSAEALAAHTRALLRIGLVQLLYLDRMPPHAAVSQTVQICAHVGERRLVNAVLRRAARERDALPLPPKEKNLARHLSVAYSFPLPLVRFFLAEYAEQTEALLCAFNRTAPLTLCVNTLRIGREALLDEFQRAGIRAEPTVHVTTGIRVLSDTPVSALPGYREGWFFVQDEASQIQGALLAPQRGERVIDVCAAPGGKSLAAAIAMGDSGEVLSADLHESKCSLIRESAARLGLRCIRVLARDATQRCDEWVDTADRVICDVPCSGLGVLGKKPDLRYKDLEATERLPALARSILKSSACYVKRGGVLIYSTCTLSQKENREVVDAFLREHTDFFLEPFTVGDVVLSDGTRTLLPHMDGTDGFYLARLRRA